MSIPARPRGGSTSLGEHQPPPMARIRAFVLALLCSFAVYVIPIVGPHAVFFLWELLGQRFRDFSRNPAWAFTELGAAFVFQAIALGAFYWWWRRRSAL